MVKIIITGCHTDAGKTVTSAIFCTALQGSYWKPVECLSEADSALMKQWLVPQSRVYPPTYSFKACLSPHHAARLEGISIQTESITPPITSHPLIIETAGGILVPLNQTTLTIDLFLQWKAKWIVVSKHYIGSINHTLMTLETLKQRNIEAAGIIFNGPSNPDTEQAILKFSNARCLGRLELETDLSKQTIERYANLWRPSLMTLL